MGQRWNAIRWYDALFLPNRSQQSHQVQIQSGVFRWILNVLWLCKWLRLLWLGSFAQIAWDRTVGQPWYLLLSHWIWSWYHYIWITSTALCFCETWMEFLETFFLSKSKHLDIYHWMCCKVDFDWPVVVRRRTKWTPVLPTVRFQCHDTLPCMRWVAMPSTLVAQTECGNNFWLHRCVHRDTLSKAAWADPSVWLVPRCKHLDL